MVKVPSSAPKGIMKELAKHLKWADEPERLAKLLKQSQAALAKPISKTGAQTATASTRAAAERSGRGAAQAAARFQRDEAIRRASGIAETGGTSWKRRVTQLYGDAPSWMPNPHGHHIVFRNGDTASKPFIEASQSILKHFDIDPTLSKHNLIWAPNANHTSANAREVLQRLHDTVAAGGSRQDIIQTLAKAGREVFDGWP